MQKIAVTGAGGYIGSKLVESLLNQDYKVLAIDRYFFGKEVLQEFVENKNLSILKKDIRDLNENDFAGIEAVCDLACLSNDPAGELNPKLTNEINRDGRIRLGEIAKKAGVSKYIFSSSCSVYGQGQDSHLNEESPTNPVSLYAKTTLIAEQKNLSLSDNDFSVTSLRNATVFGMSKRMRFDLVVNLMTLTAFKKNKITIMGGGSQWRPLVHVSDVCSAILNVLNSDNKKVNNEIFNIGLDNFQIINLAYLVKDTLKLPIEIDIAPDDADKRNYNVNFKKANNLLHFKAGVSLETGILEIFSALKSGIVDTSLKTVTVSWYKHILDSKALLDEVSLNGRVI